MGLEPVEELLCLLSLLGILKVKDGLDRTGTRKTKNGKNEQCTCHSISSASISYTASVSEVTAVRPNLTFHCLDLKSMSREKKEQLYQKLYAESENMMYKFQNLFSSTTDSLKQRNVPTKELTRHLECLGQIKPTFEDSGEPVFRHQLPQLRNKESVDDAMSVINHYCSFFNYRMLEHIINKLGTEKDKLNLLKYKEDFAKYGERHIFECPAEVGIMNEEDHTNIFVTLDEAYDHCNVSHLYAFISNLQEVLNITDITLQLKHITPGSVLLTFQMLRTIQKEIFPLSVTQEAKLTVRLGVVELSCEDYKFSLCKNEVMAPHFRWNELKADIHISPRDAETEESVVSITIESCFPMMNSSLEKLTDVYSISTDSALETGSINTGTSAKETQFSEDIIDGESDDFNIRKGLDTTANTSNFEVHIASLKGDINDVRQLIEGKYLNPLQNDINGLNALHYATRGGHKDVLKYFVEELEYNPSCFSRKGWTPLHIAARYGHLQLVEYLIAKQQVDPLCQNKAGSTPLHMACKGGDIDIVDYLINKMSDYLPLNEVSSMQNHAGFTPLHHAVYYKHPKLVQYLVNKQQIDPQCHTKDGDTLLHLACSCGSIDIVAYLVNEFNKNVPLNDIIDCRGKNGLAPIHVAALKGHLEIVKYFTDKLNCDPNVAIQEVAGFSGRVPLHAAAQGGHLNIIKFFVEQKKCNAAHVDENQVTPLHIAAQEGYLNIVKYLTLEQNCYDPIFTLKGANNNTPLHVAARRGHLEVIKFFIETLECPPSIGGWHNMTPLEQAHMKGHNDVVMYLMDISRLVTAL